MFIFGLVLKSIVLGRQFKKDRFYGHLIAHALYGFIAKSAEDYKSKESLEFL